MFHDVSVRAGPQRRSGVDLLLVHRENEHRNGWKCGVRVPDELQPAFSAQGNVGDDQIWRGLERGGGILRLREKRCR